MFKPAGWILHDRHRLTTVCTLIRFLSPISTRIHGLPLPLPRQPASFLPSRLSTPPCGTAVPPLSLLRTPLCALSLCVWPPQHGESAAHDAGGHAAGVQHGASPAGQAKHAGSLRQLLPHPHLPASHLHHCLANVSGRGRKPFWAKDCIEGPITLREVGMGRATYLCLL